MSLLKLVEGDCGGANPLMQLGGQFTRDIAHQDDGLTQAPHFSQRNLRPDEQMVSDFFGQVAGPPQSFHMDTLLQEMRDINISNSGASSQLQAAPRVIDEVATEWSKSFSLQNQQTPSLPSRMIHLQPQQQQMTHVQEFFDEPIMYRPNFSQPMPHPMQTTYLPSIAPAVETTQGDDFFDSINDNIEMTTEKNELPSSKGETVEDWINDYQSNRDGVEQTAASFNENFWQRLQDEWQKLSDENEHAWLTESNENLDIYKEYEFAEENPMSDLENAFEKGKEYLAKGDVPSAVLCFEVAVKKEPEKIEIWELLGTSQAENEMDPQAIAALKKALQLEPDNQRVQMALAVCYTNEGLPNHAVRMLTNWLQVHPNYKHLVDKYPELQQTDDNSNNLASSLIGGNKLQQLQNVYLEAVRLNPSEIDPNVQEALGVLYNLSGEYNKAVDCFQLALQVNPNNAKVWNRLGASLANGARSVEAVEAYQHALQLQPGFIRVRYNVGVCCMNLKAYKQAVEHLLTALTMQANSAAVRDLPTAATKAAAMRQNQMSDSIWSTLRMVVSLMGCSDLQGFVSDRNLEALNNAFKD